MCAYVTFRYHKSGIFNVLDMILSHKRTCLLSSNAQKACFLTKKACFSRFFWVTFGRKIVFLDEKPTSKSTKGWLFYRLTWKITPIRQPKTT